MAKRKYTEEQVVNILKESSSGIRTEDLCRKYNVSPNTFYKWRQKYAGMEVSDVKKLRALEDENRRLKTIVADLTLDNQALKAINSKNW
jgi:putative transposase